MSSTSLIPTVENTEDRTRTNSSSTPTNVILDALPYIDTVHPYYEEYAHSLIEHEIQTVLQVKKCHPLVKPLPPLNFRTEAFRHAYQECIDKIADRKDVDNNNTNEQEPIPTIFPPKPTKDTVDAWKETVKQARIAYEKERLRSIQLDLDKGVEGDSKNNSTENINDESTTKTSTTTSASSLWKRYNQQILEPQLQYYQQRLEQEQTYVATINHQRQTSQVEQYGKALSTLQLQYNELLQKQYTLKGAITNLENELQTE
jgi:hypothetical protein